MIKYHFIYIILFSTLLTLFLTGCSTRTELHWNDEGEYRWAEVSPGFFDRTGFTEVSPSKTNIDFVNRVTEEEIINNRHYLNGSGVAAGDINNDGLVDLYFTGMGSSNRLYKNLGGMEFEDITDEAGVAHEGHYSTGTVFADVNGNGHLDMLVASLYEGVALYINDGSGRFELNRNSGLENTKNQGSHTLALADITGNGYLDLYVTNYKTKVIEDELPSKELEWENVVQESKDENDEVVYSVLPKFKDYYVIGYRDSTRPQLWKIGEKDQLFLNDGSGNFEEVTDPENHFLDAEGNPLGLSRDWGLAAKFHDLNNDSRPDLYVCNDFWTPDRVWLNQGGGVFKAAGPHMFSNYSNSAMAVDFSDINRDGASDLFVTEMLSTEHERRIRVYSPPQPYPSYEFQSDKEPQYNRNSLYLNRGDNTYAEISYYSGVEASDWSWATRFLDIDLDGYEDILINTGYSYDLRDLDALLKRNKDINSGRQSSLGYIVNYPTLEIPNQIFRNNGDLTFSNVSEEWGFTKDDISHGMALADLNLDGTQDMIINRLNETSGIFRNRTNAPRIAVRLAGSPPNTQGIGANIELIGGPVEQQQTEIAAGGDYLSGSDPMAVFAADENSSDHTIKVTWPNGRQSIIQGVKANRIYEIRQENTIEPQEDSGSSGDEKKPLFEDISDRISHYHTETPYEDFQVQPLLPAKLTRRGPGIAWSDYNQDGYDDLLIASGKGGRLALFENQKDARFDSVSIDHLTDLTPSDQTSIISWTEHDKTRIVVGSTNYKQGDPGIPSAFIYTITKNGEITKDEIPGILSTTGPVAAADINGNGYLDLFIGGHFKPGQYPRDADSRIFTNNNGSFQLDKNNSHTLSEVGLVTGAVFTDLNQDGQPDLLLSTEWGTLRLFENDNGELQEVTEEKGLGQYHGWWNGVATGDFNNDGRPDIVATNMGLNSSYQIEGNQPLKIFHDDFNRDRRLDIVEAHYYEKRNAYVPRRKLYTFESIPTILQNVRSHKEFAEATVDQIFNRDFSKVPSKKINTLEQMVFINTGDGFEAHPLPTKAQLTTAFHAGVADFNNDGNEDIFLSQNFFSFSENTPRQDAGRGLILKGDGHGNFTPLSGTESGIRVYGEQRGAAISDFNKDRKTDLAVTQSNEQTRLFLNQGENPGLRVQLVGPESNRDAVGSSIRLVYEDGSKGPRREIQAGAGYWSQNSKTQVMGIHGVPSHLEVTWFDGRTESIEISDTEKDIVITH